MIVAHWERRREIVGGPRYTDRRSFPASEGSKKILRARPLD